MMSMIGGLALYLYGMNLLGAGLAKDSECRMESVLEDLTGNPRRGGAAGGRDDGGDLVLLGLRGHFAGPVSEWGCGPQSGHSHYSGTEYRHLRNRHDLRCGSQQKRQVGGVGASVF